MNRDIIRFIKKISAFIVLIIILDIALGNVLEYFFFRMKGGETSKATYAMEEVDQDVIVFGSSRANHHYVPEVFEQQLNKSFYNVGRDGQGIIYYYSVLRTILARTKPQIIVLDINPDEFQVRGNSYDRLSILLPYYSRHPELHDVINLKSEFEEYKAISNLYRFNSSVLQIAINNIIKRGKDANNGYIPNTRVWKKPIEIDSLPIGIDSVKVRFLERFIQDVKKSGSKLYVFVSPTFKIYKDEPVSIQITREICKKNEVFFSTHNQDSLFHSNPQYFKDEGHLNHEGAKIYSAMVSREILNEVLVAKQ